MSETTPWLFAATRNIEALRRRLRNHNSAELSDFYKEIYCEIEKYKEAEELKDVECMLQRVQLLPGRLQPANALHASIVVQHLKTVRLLIKYGAKLL